LLSACEPFQEVIPARLLWHCGHGSDLAVSEHSFNAGYQRVRRFIYKLRVGADGTGTIFRTGYLHFQFVNSGANVPVIASDAIIQDFKIPSTSGHARREARFPERSSATTRFCVVTLPRRITQSRR